MFSWSGQQEQHLRKLGTVSVHNRAGAFGLGIPLHLSHVPQCPSGVCPYPQAPSGHACRVKFLVVPCQGIVPRPQAAVCAA